MRVRLAAVAALLTLAISTLATGHHTPRPTADNTVCANGSNWDNVLHICH